MNDESAIPVFPCASPDETLEFYQALGFEVTHR
jgi:catechol 2,3-dioxygenase-like lactoylglutathione lyase family enzyme